MALRIRLITQYFKDCVGQVKTFLITYLRHKYIHYKMQMREVGSQTEGGYMTGWCGQHT